MKIAKKISIYLGLGTAILGSGIGAAYYITSNKDNDKDKFKSVTFNGNKFNSKSDILKYIDQNKKSISKDQGELLFSVGIGNDFFQFNKYNDAYDYVLKRLKPIEIYLKPGQTIDPISTELNANQFIEKKVFYKKNDNDLVVDKKESNKIDNQRKFYAFQKMGYSNDLSNSNLNNHSNTKYNYDNNKHGYIVVPASASANEIEKARSEAALTYIQVHSAYKFDDVYFPNVNDVKSYIYANQSKNTTFEKSMQIGFYKSLAFKDGSSFNFSTDESKPQSFQINELINQEKYKNAISANSNPYYKYHDTKGNVQYISLDQNRINDLEKVIPENSLPYIKVDTNQDNITNIVDMDNNVPNGNFYGPYFISSGMSYDKISDVSNWHQVKNESTPDRNELVDFTIIKSTISYLLKSNGFNSPLDLMASVTNSQNGPSLFEFLGDESNFSKSGNGLKYLKLINKLIINIGKGRNYNNLDAIIAMYKYMIDNMLQNHENASSIIEVAKYFNSMTIILDSLLQKFLAPYISPNINNKNSRINYFQEAFSFYNPNISGFGIDILKTPSSYYRKLLGLKDNNFSLNDNRLNIFKLIEAAMGIHSLTMKAIMHNEETYAKWAYDSVNKIKKQTILNISTSNILDKLEFTSDLNNRKKLWDFSFNPDIKASSDEKGAIWKNINSISNSDIDINGLKISKYNIINNVNDYLQGVVNLQIKHYKKKVSEKISELILKHTDHKIIDPTGQTRKMILEKSLEYKSGVTEAIFSININNYIELDLTKIKDVTVNTSYNDKNLSSMVKDAVKPLKDRIKDFATVVGTVAVKAAMGIAGAMKSAASMGEATIIEREMDKTFSLSVKNNITSIKVKGKSFYLNNFSESKIYKEHSIIKETTKMIKPTNKKKSWLKITQDAIDGAGNSSGNNKNLEDHITDFYGNYFTWFLPGGIRNKVFNVIKDIFDVGIRIIKNVIPGVSQIFSLINSFSSSETQTYAYATNTNPQSYFWDGGLVNYSWWGLSSNQKYSIKDLKMIDIPVIVSGHSSGTTGFYYGNNYYASIDKLKYEQSKKLVKLILSKTKIEINNLSKNPQNSLYKKIVWKIPLQNVGGNRYFDSLDDLIKFAADISIKSKIPKKLYKLSDGTLTSSMGKALDSTIKSLINKLKPVMVVELPKIINDKIIVNNNFRLPYPYYHSSKQFNAPKNYISKNDFTKLVLNPNVSVDDSKPYFKSLTDSIKHSLKNMSAQKYESSINSLKNLLGKYVKNLYIPNKKVIWDEISSKYNNTFENLNNKWSENSQTIYKFQNGEGILKYYKSKQKAVKFLLSDGNYDITTRILGRKTFVYKFDNKIFNSINKIYDYVIKQPKIKGESHV